MICEKCGKMFDDALSKCPWCNEIQADNMEELKEDNEKQEESLTSKSFCKYCGSEIEAGKNYCKHCGNSTVEKGKMHCTQCGEVLEEKQQFCERCGHKVPVVVLPKSVAGMKEKMSKKKIAVFLSSFVLAVALIITGIIFIPKLFISYEDYLTDGNYEKAYEKANDEEKKIVMKENIVAINSISAKDNLKDASSFVLRKAYIPDDMSNVVLEVQGANSYGGNVTGWYLYYYSKNDGEYKFWGSQSDLEKEEEKSYDDADEKLEKSLNNLSKTVIKELMKDDKNKVDLSVVDRINELNQKGQLKSTKLLDGAKQLLDKNKEEEKES
ncbi:MAG: zinc ribbon domain-containing protein [Eubacterium sp.]|nr:zinc ribbon domain-containing protein [Eubacterium sp.]